MSRRDERPLIEREVPRERVHGGQQIRIHPDPDRPRWYVLVRVTRTRRGMRHAIRGTTAYSMDCEIERRVMGMTFSRGSYRRWRLNRDWRPDCVAVIYMNRADLAQEPNNIAAHEIAHAALAWARMQRADLSKMEGEEVVCYAVGYMQAQFVRAAYALGWFGG